MKYRFMRFPGFKTKALTFSFDDGSFHDKKLMEIFQKYKMKATFNLSNNAQMLSDRECADMYYADGHEIAVHGAEHRALMLSDSAEGIREVLGGREFLEKKYNKIIRGFAYPDRCATNARIEEYLKMLGIAYARTAGGETGSLALPSDWLCWRATCKHNDPKIMEYADKFLNENPREKYIASRDSLLFYVWGHSWELENDWSPIERFCGKMSDNPDVWYATNMDIYEYAEAYRSLVFSSDHSIVTNPTLKTIYFESGDDRVKINPGETKYL